MVLLYKLQLHKSDSDVQVGTQPCIAHPHSTPYNRELIRSIVTGCANLTKFLITQTLKENPESIKPSDCLCCFHTITDSRFIKLAQADKRHLPIFTPNDCTPGTRICVSDEALIDIEFNPSLRSSYGPKFFCTDN